MLKLITRYVYVAMTALLPLNCTPTNILSTDRESQGKGRGERGYPTCSTTSYLWRKTNVRSILHLAAPQSPSFIYDTRHTIEGYQHTNRNYRADDKLVKDYDLEGGATLHLVLALRGGFL